MPTMSYKRARVAKPDLAAVPELVVTDSPGPDGPPRWSISTYPYDDPEVVARIEAQEAAAETPAPKRKSKRA